MRDGMIRWQDWERTVKASAWRYLKRAHAAGAKSVQLEDVQSELSVAWCIARDKFNPDHGVPFGAYLQTGMRNHINRWIDDQIGEVGFDLDDTGASGEEDRYSMIPDGAQGQDDVLAESQTFKRNMALLSPEARKFVEILADPPLALYEEMTAIQARAEFAKSRGIQTGAPGHITGALVMDLIGAERVDRNRIYAEVKRVARQSVR